MSENMHMSPGPSQPPGDAAGAATASAQADGDPAMAELLAIFQGPLRDVAFPDVSRATLVELRDDADHSLTSRDACAAALAEAEEVLALAEAAVAAARASLREAESQVDDRQRALLARAQRALSYAKVFAETDPALHARLSAISLSRITQRTRTSNKETNIGEPARRRGRPRRSEPVEPSVSS